MSCEIDGYNDVERTTRPRARKEHECDGCDDKIRPGEIYVRTFFVWEGEPSTVRHCLRCDALFHAIARRQRDFDMDLGVQYDFGCGHSWKDIFEEDAPPDVARLAFMTAEEAQREFAR